MELSEPRLFGAGSGIQKKDWSPHQVRDDRRKTGMTEYAKIKTS